MAYKIFIIALFLSVLASCNSKQTIEITDQYENGSVKKEVYYNNSESAKSVIKEIEYYEGGEKKYVGNFKNNKKDGKWTFWFQDGKMWSEGYFTKGLRSGESKVYYENGELFFIGEYINGKKVNTWTFYDEKGNIKNIVTYENGKIVSQKDKVEN